MLGEVFAALELCASFRRTYHCHLVELFVGRAEIVNYSLYERSLGAHYNHLYAV